MGRDFFWPRAPDAAQRVALRGAVRCRAGALSSVGVRDGPGSAKQREDAASRPAHSKTKWRSFLRHFYFRLFASDHCSSFSTLCCDWLASASAETAIDWRVDSAWLLAASSLVSASVRLDEPVCSTLIRFLLKS